MLRIRVLGLSRAAKQSSMLVADLCGFILCVLAAVWLLFGDHVPLFSLLMLCLASVLVALPLTSYFDLYRSIVRYMGVDLFVAGIKSTVLSAIALGIVSQMTNLVPAPFRWAFAFWALSLIYLVGSRFMARLFLNRSNSNRGRSSNQ